jgi:hypothetical protein
VVLTTETRYQRVAREQAERQAARVTRILIKSKADARAIRAARKHDKEARRERAYLEALTSDHNLDPGE